MRNNLERRFTAMLEIGRHWIYTRSTVGKIQENTLRHCVADSSPIIFTITRKAFEVGQHGETAATLQ